MPEYPQNGRDVLSRGSHADVQFACDLGVAESTEDQREHLALPRGERGGEGQLTPADPGPGEADMGVKKTEEPMSGIFRRDLAMDLERPQARNGGFSAAVRLNDPAGPPEQLREVLLQRREKMARRLRRMNGENEGIEVSPAVEVGRCHTAFEVYQTRQSEGRGKWVQLLFPLK